MRKLLAFVGGLLALIGAMTLAAGLLVARIFGRHGLDAGVDREPDPRDLEVLAVDDGRVRLRPASRRVRISPSSPGVWGLESDRGYDQAGPVIESLPDGSVVRELRLVQGAVEPGDRVRLDPFAHPADPAAAHGLHFEEVLVPARAGSFPAWRLDGERDTWAIFVHGKGAGRREALRILPTVHAAGFPGLVISYRNDPGVIPDRVGRYGYGATEWEEVEAAAEYALKQGAVDLIIFAYSMGGGIAMSFMRRSPLAARVRGLVLDAPMLNLERTVAHGASQTPIPVPFLAVSNRITSRLYHIRWSDLDYLSDTSHLHVPVLLFHGDADTVVPVETSDAFAAAREDIVTYVRVEGAGHVRSWNSDREGYERAVQEFLARVAR